MKTGIIKVKDLTEEEKAKILNNIIGMCIREAGNSYTECGRSVTKYLKKIELVDYGN